MINNHDPLERYLSEFQPRPVRKLVVPPQPVTPWLRRLAAAAVLILATGISLWLANHRNTSAPKIAIAQPQSTAPVPPFKELGALALSKLAIENSSAFDSYLLNQSRYVLPNPQGEQSTLRILVAQ